MGVPRARDKRNLGGYHPPFRWSQPISRLGNAAEPWANRARFPTTGSARALAKCPNVRRGAGVVERGSLENC